MISWSVLVQFKKVVYLCCYSVLCVLSRVPSAHCILGWMVQSATAAYSEILVNVMNIQAFLIYTQFTHNAVETHYILILTSHRYTR